MSGTQLLLLAAVALPALAFVLWPFLRGGGRPAGVLPVSSADERQLELAEEKGAILRALKELAFDHEAGHLSEDDYRALRDRYEGRAAEILEALDRLPPTPSRPPRPERPARPASGRGWTRHPVALAGGATVVLVFGVALGVGIGRFTEPDQSFVPPGGRLPVPVAPGGLAPMMGAVPPGPPPEGGPAGGAVSPEIMAGMLGAARQSLTAGRYPEAIAAYQAVLKRDPRNVDAMTHLGLIIAIGGHADSALETFDRALAIAPDYAPAHLYRGQVLYETKADYAGAIRAWERFLAVAPQGAERERVAALIAEARSKQGAR